MTKPPTVLLFTDSHSLCGVGRFNASFLSALCQSGYHAVSAQIKENTPLQESLADQGVEYVWFERGPDIDVATFANDRETPREIFKTVSPDLILFSNGVPPGTVGATEVAREVSIPYVIREGLVAPPLLEADGQEIDLLRKNYLGAGQIVFVSQENRQVLQQCLGFPEDFGVVVPSSAEDAFFEPVDFDRRGKLRREWGVPEDGILCFTTAQLETFKGHDVLLNAIFRLMSRPEWDRLHFVWAGIGSQETRLQEQIRLIGVDDRVRLLGYVWNVAELLDAADLFVLPSQYEGLPHSIIEAMAKGLVPIATAVGGVPEIMHGCGTLLENSRDEEKCTANLTEAIVLWVNDAEGRRRAGEMARSRVHGAYNDSTVMQKFLEIVRKEIATAR